MWHPNLNQKKIIEHLADCIDIDIERMSGDETVYTDEIETISEDFDKEAVLERLMISVNSKRSVWRRKLIGVAAALALLIVGASIVWMRSQPDTIALQQIYAEKGERMTVLLADGTRVTLNADSRLIYPERFDGQIRRVKLVGEAFFEVAHDQAHPFYVDTYNMEIKVTGTQFNVASYPEYHQITTTLFEGSVLIGDSALGEKAMLPMTQGDVAVYEKGTGKVQITHDAATMQARDCRSHVFTASNEKLMTVVRRIERQFGVSISVRNKAILDYTYTIACDTKDIHAIIDIMETITPVRFTKITTDRYEVR
ncbi:sigma factor regulatory protein, FecR/PupR family [Hallella bergensis DSM 17361]|uniref:Sigma factor regulatory protein, FecR/PupR family n=1 Tax=Hallella bergensis DSM 17361 TaxID=585502 RepID=D1PWX9_9BACT|nr:FecR domain-containing protein [Hallella bergensis]EFA44105.1 sigma factor regulatory protein, FecR/PupR family [Hallella bergensis DSM 17361]